MWFSSLFGCSGPPQAPDPLAVWQARERQNLAAGVVRLSDLDLHPTAAQLLAVLEDPGTAPVQDLRLSQVGLTTEVLAAVADHPKLQDLRGLSLTFNPDLGDEALAIAGRAGWWSSLTRLEVDGTGITGAGLAALAGAGDLTHLSVGHGDRGPSLDLPDLPSLTWLSAVEAGLSGSGALALLARPGLEALVLDGNALGPGALEGVQLGVALQGLGLEDCGLGPGDAAALAGAPSEALRSVSLDRNPLGDEGLDALTGATWWAGLETVGLVGTGGSPERVEAIRASWGPQQAGRAITP